MAANTTPIFTITPVVGTARLTTAITASDGSGSPTVIVSAGIDGTRIDSVTFTNSQIAYGASTAAVGKVFVSDTAGSNYRIVQEVALATATRSNSAIGATATINFPGGLIIPSGSKIAVGSSVADTTTNQIDVVARGGNF